MQTQVQRVKLNVRTTKVPFLRLLNDEKRQQSDLCLFFAPLLKGQVLLYVRR